MNELTPASLLNALNALKEAESDLFKEYTLDVMVNDKKVSFKGVTDESERLNLIFYFEEAK